MKAQYIFSILDDLQKILAKDEVLFVNVNKEQSDFVRFSQGKIRQPGTVLDQSISLTLIAGKKQMSFSCNLTADEQTDKEMLHFSIKWLQQEVATAVDDPYVLYDTNPQTSENIKSSSIDSKQIVEDVLNKVKGADFVGILASGNISSFLWSSLGHRYQHSVDTFNLDSSFYHHTDKAIKQSYAGQTWEAAKFNAKCDLSLQQLEVLKKPSKTIKPGDYRVYLAPAAMEEVMGIWSWGGFSQKSVQTKNAPFLKWLENKTNLSPKFSMQQDNQNGLDCLFDSKGFLLPDSVSIIDQGVFKNALTSPRTSKEYDLPLNCGSSESPTSLSLATGSLAQKDVLKELGTGIYCSNLWYLNYSDLPSGRITGMTRFGCFWVEDGELQAPINVMRFDDTLQNMLGTNLEKVTEDKELILDTSSYYGRTLNSGRYVGMLLSNLCFTL